MARKKKPRRRVKKTPAPSLSDQLEKQREKVFMAQGIVSCAHFASDSMLVGEPNLADGLKAAEEILSDVAEALELMIADEK